MREKYIKQWTDTYSEQTDARLEKRAKMVEAKSNPYKTDIRPNTTASELRARHDAHSKEDMVPMETDYSIAGRAMPLSIVMMVTDACNYMLAKMIFLRRILPNTN